MPFPPQRVDFKMPAGAVDSHAHVFGPAAAFALANGCAYTPADATVDDYTAMLDGLGLARGVLVQGSAHGLDNAVMLHALAMATQRLRGIAVVRSGTGARELRRLAGAGVVGLRFYSDGDRRHGGGVGVDAACELAAELAALRMHAELLVTGDGLREQLARVRGIACPLVVDHFGGIDVDAGVDGDGFRALRELLADGGCWVKLSGIYRLSRQPPGYGDMRAFHDALVRTNPGRLLWGSDWPHPNFAGAVPCAAHLLDLFAAWTPDPRTRHRILVDNPSRLFGFS